MVNLRKIKKSHNKKRSINKIKFLIKEILTRHR